MRHEAVALSYLEWVRLIGTGAIRLDEQRIVRWRQDRADYTDVVSELMLAAPDLGTSATSYVLAMLEPEVLDRIREGGLYLGKRLNLESVRSFHSFGDAALPVHRHDAEAAGVQIDLTPLAVGWAPWAAAVEAADRRARGAAMLVMLDVSSCDRFNEATGWLANRERCIAHDDIVRARDSMFFGWACVLNAHKVSTGVAPILPSDVKDEAAALRGDFNVDQPFLARAPLLRDFVTTLAADGNRPEDLLVMASLKQHERYVIKREGAAVDLQSLFDDIRILEELDVGAAGFLVQALGERLPSELVRAIKAQGVTRVIAPTDVSTSAGEGAPEAPGQIDRGEVVPTYGPPMQLGPLGEPNPPEHSVVPAASEGFAGSAVETAIVVIDEASRDVPSENVSEPRQKDDALSRSTVHQGTSAPAQLGLDLSPQPTREVGSPPMNAAYTGPEEGQKAGAVSGRKSIAGKSTTRAKKPKKQKDQTIR